MPRLSPRDRYRWNAKSARYVDQRTGRFVSGRSVRRALDIALKNSSREAISLTNAMRAGRIQLGTWQDAMRTTIRDTHFYSAAASKGGWAELDAADFGRLGQITRTQYEYLNRFASRLESGELPLDGRILRYAEMYVQAGRRTYHLFERDDKADAGYEEERSVLSAGESCAECIEEDAADWVPIGDMTPIGDRTCLANCNCSVEYRVAPPNLADLETTE